MIDSPTATRASDWPHRWAVLLVALTFPLVWVGGLVTTTEAGMAVPDWPTTYGYNLFLYPWQTWLFGTWDLFIEHGHRLLAATVGMVTIAFAIVTWLRDGRSLVRWLTVLAVIGVVAQGVLGGMRVVLDARLLAKLHACLGNAFLALTVLLMAMTSRPWRELTSERVAGADRLRRLAVTIAALAFTQIVLGAQLRHLSPGVNVTIFRLSLVFHIFVAVAIAAHALMLAACRVGESNLKRFAHPRSRWLAALVAAQLSLGLGTWLVNYGWPSVIARPEWAERFTVVSSGWWQTHVTTAHVALGAAIWALSVSLMAWTWRLSDCGSAAARPMFSKAEVLA